MTATRPDPAEPLVGRFITLRQLTRDDLPALFEAIAHPIVFAGGYGGGIGGYRADLPGFLEWAETAFRWDDGNVYAVIMGGDPAASEPGAGPHDGQLVGSTTMTDFDEPNEATHIGYTSYDPRVWGTAVNAEVKRLLLGRAFDSGFGRVRIQADDMNERSKAAIHRIGATFEGVMRRDRRRADGSWRDTAVFSVIIDDWPRVRALLDERLDAHSGHPVFFRPVPEGGWR